MGAPPLVRIDELEARLGREFVGTETNRAAAVLEDASELVRAESGKTWVNSDNELITVPGSVRAVVFGVSERAIRNPDGYSAETAGDYSYQRAGVQPGVYLTENESRILRKASGRSGLWTQATTRVDEDYEPSEWVTGFGSEPFPVGPFPFG